MSRAKQVFDQNNGDVTKAYYAEMNTKGLLGQLAVALFRAQKRSTAAKKYRGRQYRRAAYDVKNWSLSEICRIAKLVTAELPGRIVYGWKEDPHTPVFSWVLYVQLPEGQCSFHSSERLDGPEFPSEWDGLRMSEEHILAFCDRVATEELVAA